MASHVVGSWVTENSLYLVRRSIDVSQAVLDVGMRPAA